MIGDNYQSISPYDRWVFDASGNLAGASASNRSGKEARFLTADQATALQALAITDGIAAPATNLTAAVGSAGALTGAYYYTQTYVTALGETAPWPGSATVVNPSSQQVNLSAIPTGPAGTIARRIYRTPAVSGVVDPKDYRLVATINDNTTTTYTDNLADGSLGAPANWNATNRGQFTEAGGVKFSFFSDQSVGFGQGAFATNTGYASVAIGYQALTANTTGRRNTAVGVYSLTALTTGYWNTAIGVHSGQSLTTGAYCTFLGAQAGYNGITADSNTAVGYQALLGTGSGLGANNTALGFRALGDINTAASCIGIGYAAGKYANNARQVFIDNQDRANIAGCQHIGLIYGKAETTAAAQVLHLNAQTRIGAGDAPVVAGLPAAAAGYKGYRGYVTDATVAYISANLGSTVAGGGSNCVPVFCTGAAWVIG